MIHVWRELPLVTLGKDAIQVEVVAWQCILEVRTKLLNIRFARPSVGIKNIVPEIIDIIACESQPYPIRWQSRRYESFILCKYSRCDYCDRLQRRKGHVVSRFLNDYGGRTRYFKKARTGIYEGDGEVRTR